MIVHQKLVSYLFAFVIIIIVAFILKHLSYDNSTYRGENQMKRIKSFSIIPKINHAYRFIGDPVVETTTDKVPDIFRNVLKQMAPIDETVSSQYPAQNAVNKLEAVVGWDSANSKFENSSIIDFLRKEWLGDTVKEKKCPISKEALLNTLLKGAKLHHIMDIVVPSIRDLDFLEKWKPFIENFHVIIIQDGDCQKHLQIPSWVDYELYNRNDIEKALGSDAWIISQRDASIRNFGFLVSNKKFLWSLDDDCYPATDAHGNPVNAIMEHALNLLTPSTPYFFNTVYDPYQSCTDFVRGYPYSLRRGVQTAVSHGLWQNNYDYDAPTQLLKVEEKNLVYADVTITIPKRVLYPLCSMNVAFNRELIGPALMQGLMGSGQPWGRYDDMFSGWASKVVADHLGLGSKSGAPYILHNKASNPFTNLAKEYMGLLWQEYVIRFFDELELSPSSDSPSKAYLELADLIEEKLTDLSPYFLRLATAMRRWVHIWNEKEIGKLKFLPSRSSKHKD